MGRKKRKPEREEKEDRAQVASISAARLRCYQWRPLVHSHRFDGGGNRSTKVVDAEACLPTLPEDAHDLEGGAKRVSRAARQAERAGWTD